MTRSLFPLSALADDRTDRIPKIIDGVPVIGGLDKLKTLIREGGVDQVLVSLPWSAKDRLRQIVDTISENPIKIRLAPDLAAFEYLNRDFTSLGGLPVMDLFDRPLSGFDSLLKALEDYIIGDPGSHSCSSHYGDCCHCYKT